MKQKVHYLLTLAGLICLINQTGYAQKLDVKQPTSKDREVTHPLSKITVSVKDLASSKLIDSVRIMMGDQTQYTKDGIAVFENLSKDSLFTFSKPGYYRIVKKAPAKGKLTVLLQKTDEEPQGSIGLNIYQRQAVQFSGSAVKIDGNDLRKINSTNLIDALKYYVPALSVSRSNKNGSDPNILPDIKLRGTNNFPTAATVVNNNTGTSGVQLNPSSGDFVATGITSPGIPVILLDGLQVDLQTAMDIDINRIQTVTVLKDATATTGYGMRGGNGIISIQTIRPKSGMNVSFTEQVQVASADISSYNLLNAQEKLDLENKAGLYTGNLSSVYQKRNNQTNTNWLSLPLQNGVGAKHSLNLGGGNEDVVYGLNASYNDVQGSMKGSNRKSTDLSAFFGGHVRALSFDNRFSFLNVNAANSPYGSLSQYVRMNPYWSPFDPVTGKMQKIVEADTINGAVKTYMNPAYNATIATTDASKYTRFSNISNINLVLGGGFQLNGIAGISKQSDELNQFLPPSNTAFANVSVDNLFTRGSYNYVANSFLSAEGGLRLQYNNKFGKHEFSATAGENLQQTSSESSGLTVSGFTVDRLSDIAFGSAYSTTKPAAGKIVTRYASTFGNFLYSYDDRFQVDLSATQDYYSGLGNNDAKFWAAGLSWNLHREKFIESINWINLLKLRASAGTAGSQNFLSYLNRTTYGYYTDHQYVPAGAGFGTRGIGLGAYLTGYGNTNIASPKTFKQNAGVDASLFNKRLSVSIDAYKQRTYRLFLPNIADPSTGLINFSTYQNYGSIENHGIEFNTIGTIYKDAKNNLTWNLALNGLYNKDKVTAIAPYLSALNTAGNTTADQTQLQSQYQVGYSPTAIWAVPSFGINPQTGKETFLKKDGSTTTTWDANDKVYDGDLMPAFVGSFGTDATFRQFSGGIFFNYQYGSKVQNTALSPIDLAYNVDSRVSSQPLLDPAHPSYLTTLMVKKDKKIQCGSIMLGYTLPKMLAQKIKANNLAFKCVVNNAFEWGGAEMEKGIYYPFQRNYTFSLNANF